VFGPFYERQPHNAIGPDARARSNSKPPWSPSQISRNTHATAQEIAIRILSGSGAALPFGGTEVARSACARRGREDTRCTLVRDLGERRLGARRRTISHYLLSVRAGSWGCVVRGGDDPTAVMRQEECALRRVPRAQHHESRYGLGQEAPASVMISRRISRCSE
jgi:hypothetical protein